jgi:hypothetical protein
MVTLAFFIISVTLHWYFSWKVFVNEQLQHGQAVNTGDYVTEMMRDAMENWQSVSARYGRWQVLHSW